MMQCHRTRISITYNAHMCIQNPSTSAPFVASLGSSAKEMPKLRCPGKNAKHVENKESVTLL